MTDKYVLQSVEFAAKSITVYEEPNPKIKDLEEVVYKIREIEKTLDKMLKELAGLRYRAENEITELMYT